MQKAGGILDRERPQKGAKIDFSGGASQKGAVPLVSSRWGEHRLPRKVFLMHFGPQIGGRPAAVQRWLGQRGVNLKGFLEGLLRLLVLSLVPQNHSEIVPGFGKLRQSPIKTLRLLRLPVLLICEGEQ